MQASRTAGRVQCDCVLLEARHYDQKRPTIVSKSCPTICCNRLYTKGFVGVGVLAALTCPCHLLREGCRGLVRLPPMHTFKSFGPRVWSDREKGTIHARLTLNPPFEFMVGELTGVLNVMMQGHLCDRFCTATMVLSALRIQSIGLVTFCCR